MPDATERRAAPPSRPAGRAPATATAPGTPGAAIVPGPAGAALAAPPADAGSVTLPNAITLLRLCAVPATVWLILQQRLDLAFWLFVAAGLSDAADGWLARVRRSRSALGALLDPAADKALLVSVYVTLAAVGRLPDWLAILVVFRDLLIVGGLLVLTLLGQTPAIRPLLVSKLNTALQIALAAASLLAAGFAIAMPHLLSALVWLVAATTVASGAAYVAGGVRRGAAGRAP